MLQEAHIGLGIIGHEGTAAAQASDFAFTKFKYLRRALLVHGHWYYIRCTQFKYLFLKFYIFISRIKPYHLHISSLIYVNFRAAFLIQYSFYKNIAFCTSQFFYMFFSNYSANSLFESYFLVMFNTLYTFFPVFVYAILEQNIPAETLISQPTLYLNNKKNALMSHQNLVKWIGLGLWHSIVTFFVCYFVYTDSETDLWTLQTAIAQSVVIVVNLKILIESKYWNVWLVVSVVFSILFFSVFTLLLQTAFPFDNWLVDSTYYMIYVNLMTCDMRFWTSTCLAVVVALLPDYLIILSQNVHLRTKPKCNTTVPFVEPVI